MNIALLPSFATAALATGGFAGWIRLRRGFFPRRRDVATQFALSFSAGLFLGYKYLQSQQRSRDAFRRMMNITEGTSHVRFDSSGAVKVDVADYDTATGINAEAETARLFDEASRELR